MKPRFPARFALLLLTLPSTLVAAPSDGREEASRLLYQECGSCHGGRLMGGLGPSLVDGHLQNMDDKSLREVIQHGRQGTPMPPWGRVLTEGQISHLIELLRQMEQRP